MPFYVKTVKLEARQFTPENAADVARWCGGSLVGKEQKEIKLNNNGVRLSAVLGDYIAEISRGEFYPYAKASFEEAYTLCLEESMEGSNLADPHIAALIVSVLVQRLGGSVTITQEEVEAVYETTLSEVAEDGTIEFKLLGQEQSIN